MSAEHNTADAFAPLMFQYA